MRPLRVPVAHAPLLVTPDKVFGRHSCRRRLGDRLRGHAETIGERLVRDRDALLPLPPALYEACEKEAAQDGELVAERYDLELQFCAAAKPTGKP